MIFILSYSCRQFNGHFCTEILEKQTTPRIAYILIAHRIDFIVFKSQVGATKHRQVASLQRCEPAVCYLPLSQETWVLNVSINPWTRKHIQSHFPWNLCRKTPLWSLLSRIKHECKAIFQENTRFLTVESRTLHLNLRLTRRIKLVCEVMLKINVSLPWILLLFWSLWSRSLLCNLWRASSVSWPLRWPQKPPGEVCRGHGYGFVAR